MKFKTASKRLRETAVKNGHVMEIFRTSSSPFGKYSTSTCIHCGEYLYIDSYSNGTVYECGGDATEMMCKRPVDAHERVQMVALVANRIKETIVDANIYVTGDEYVIQYFKYPNTSYRISIPKKDVV